MDLKKINFRNILGFLDELANKVPENIASIITKAVIAIFAVILIAAAYYGWSIGKENAPEEGQSLADDARALFYEDIQREYNRKRRDVRMPDLNPALLESRNESSMQYEYSLKNPDNSKREILKEENKNLENEKSLRSIQRNYNSPPILEEKEMNTIRNSSDNIPGRKTPDKEAPSQSEDLIKNSNTINTGRLLKKQDTGMPKSEIKKSNLKRNEDTVEDSGYLRKRNPDDESPKDIKAKNRQLIKRKK
ncbi:MAG: hypothetical protein L6Q54_10940 [Leptospiraceae bacterium]|nr:hypothetical protein [Leptospiraceae bacterium]MCK6381744.1 hypothetical protein [Leptospiraceae bacterium]